MLERGMKTEQRSERRGRPDKRLAADHVGRCSGVEKMDAHEIRMAAGKVLSSLTPRGKLPILVLRKGWPEDELSFYMGLGALILQHQVALQEWEGTIWVVRDGEGEIAASLQPCRSGVTPGGDSSICTACPSLLDSCPSGGSARLLLAA